MSITIEGAIEKLMERAATAASIEAQQLAQAALNLAHARQLMMLNTGSWTVKTKE